MLTLLADQPDCLWDDALPVEVKELPADLAALDELLCDQELLWPIVERWRQEFVETGRLVSLDQSKSQLLRNGRARSLRGRFVSQAFL